MIQENDDFGRASGGWNQLNHHDARLYTTGLMLHDTTSLSRFNLIHPPADDHAVWNKLGALEVLHVTFHRRLELREWQKVQVVGFELGTSFGSSRGQHDASSKESEVYHTRDSSRPRRMRPRS